MANMYSARTSTDENIMTKLHSQRMGKDTSKGPGSVFSDSGYSSTNSNKDGSSVIVDRHTSDCASLRDFSTSDPDNSCDKMPVSITKVCEGFSPTQICGKSNSAVEPAYDKKGDNATDDKDNSNITLKNTSLFTPKDSSSSATHSNHKIMIRKLSSGEMEQNKQKRFNRTAKALRDSGLLPIAIQTGNLLKRNLVLQKEIDKLKKDVEAFLQTIPSESSNNMDLDKCDTDSDNSMT